MRREQGLHITWVDAFGVISSPELGAILVLGLLLLAVFLFWLLVANLIYEVTLGPKPPASIAAFARDVFTTSQGWTMIVIGMGVGFLFALLVFAAWCRFRCCSTETWGWVPQYRRRSALWLRTRARWPFGV